MNKYHVAVVGATGLVGQEFVKILEQRDFPLASLKLLASERSAGKTLTFKSEKLVVEELTPQSFKNIDIGLFSAGSSISRHFSPIATGFGTVVIDNSSAWRMEPSVPLVVPEVNADDIKLHSGIIANPNCSTIQMVVALWPLHQVNPIKRLVVSTYQSVSGTGKPANEELISQTKDILSGRTVTPHVYPHQIAFNIIPEIDVFLDDGYTREEWKMLAETRKIMHAPDLLVSATCVRVPVFTSHSESVNIEFTRPMSIADAQHILSSAVGLKIIDDTDVNLYPMPWTIAGTDVVCVGRLRNDSSHPNGLAMWIVADNLRKGAALNTIQIAEVLISKEWLHPGGEGC
jgi:aspartate-semialdehyde dehydrogenase